MDKEDAYAEYAMYGGMPYLLNLNTDDEKYDYLIGMEQMNIRNMMRILGSDPDHKVYRLLDFTDEPGDIADPWYTRRFNYCYEDVKRGCEELLRKTEGEN